MSEFAYLPTSQLTPPGPPPPRPEAFLGAVSPLWGYYMAAAAGGVAYWWMTRWTQPESLAAFFRSTAPSTSTALVVVPDQASSLVATADAAAGEAASLGAQALSEATTSAAEALSEPVLPEAPVGGEAAPISPVVGIASTSILTKETRSRPRPVSREPDDV